jgi:hypothetical protein
MTPIGQDRIRAALIYLIHQHKTQGADRKIVDRLDALIQSHRDTPAMLASGRAISRESHADDPEARNDEESRQGMVPALLVSAGAGDGNRSRITRLEEGLPQGWSVARLRRLHYWRSASVGRSVARGSSHRAAGSSRNHPHPTQHDAFADWMTDHGYFAW